MGKGGGGEEDFPHFLQRKKLVPRLKRRGEKTPSFRLQGCMRRWGTPGRTVSPRFPNASNARSTTYVVERTNLSLPSWEGGRKTISACGDFAKDAVAGIRRASSSAPAITKGEDGLSEAPLSLFLLLSRDAQTGKKVLERISPPFDASQSSRSSRSSSSSRGSKAACAKDLHASDLDLEEGFFRSKKKSRCT